jgi:hypothetical protein
MAFKYLQMQTFRSIVPRSQNEKKFLECTFCFTMKMKTNKLSRKYQRRNFGNGTLFFCNKQPMLKLPNKNALLNETIFNFLNA